MAGQTVTISVLADTKQFASGMKGTTAQFDVLKKGAAVLAGAITAAVAAAGVALVKFGKDAIESGSTAEQSINGVSVLFGEHAQTIIDESKRAADQWGISAEDYRQSALTIEGGMKRAGMSFEESRERGDKLRGNLLDLVAVYGGDLPSALNAYGAAMRGEFDPLEQFGVKLKESAVQAKAKEMGLWDGKGALDEYARAVATTTLIEENAAAVQGAAAGRAQTFAGQVEKLTAKWDDFKERIGLVVLPVLSQLVDIFTEHVSPALEDFAAWFEAEGAGRVEDWLSWLKTDGLTALQRFGDWFTDEGLPAIMDFAGWVKDDLVPVMRDDMIPLMRDEVVPAFQKFADWIDENSWLFDMVAGALRILTKQQTDLVNAVVFVVSTLTDAVKLVQSAWAEIQAAFEEARAAIQAKLEAIKAVIEAKWGEIVAFFGSIPQRIRDAFGPPQSVMDSQGRGTIGGFWSGATGAWGAVVGWFQGLPGQIQGLLGNVGGLLSSAGSSIISGFVSAAQATWESLKGFFSGIAGWISANKGPIEKDRLLLKPAGLAIMGGFRDALADGYADVQRMVREIGPSLAGDLSGTLGVEAALAGGGTVNVYQLDGMTIEAGSAEAELLAEFVAFARRKVRAA